jgi:hypothetical protein
LHDARNLDGAGIPSLIVSSTAFMQAAEVQSKQLGYDPTVVWVTHPIQDRTDEELRLLADNAFEEIVAKLTASQ